jgi:hypothetical protein
LGPPQDDPGLRWSVGSHLYQQNGAANVSRELPALDESMLTADDIVHLCGLGSFPASDPPSWWT